MVIEPLPFGVSAIEPPAPVLIVAVDPEAVSTLMVRLALAPLPELTETAVAPELASSVAPLFKVTVGALRVKLAALTVACRRRSVRKR